jgi:ubiquinone/menaquinone biosynthesis C-methylase UbiE
VVPDSNKPQDRWERNRSHWSKTLDAQNLGEEKMAVPLQAQLDLYQTDDVVRCLRRLEPLEGKSVLDLGGGLGLMAILLAERGAHVIIADISLPRLKEARRLVAERGLAQRVHLVLCAAEHLPFRDDSLDRETCKSVLIHTDLPHSATELARILRPGGSAVLIEPLTGNPFVNLYRRLAAPSIWRDITDYFTPARLAILLQPFRQRGFTSRVRPSFFLAFFATPLNYTLHMPRAYRLLEGVLLGLDGLLFALLPVLKRFCWFASVEISSRDR